MMWSICSSKGGVGASVLAATLAIESARTSEVLLVDLDGDQPDILGVETPELGLRDWLRSDADGESIENLTVPVGSRLRLLAAGEGDATDVSRLAALLPQFRVSPIVIFDVGVANAEPFSMQSMVMAASDRTSLVIRACYVALRRAQRLHLEPHDTVEVVEGGRALTTADLEGALGLPVTARVPVDPHIARAVDAGMLLHRRPRSLRRCAQDLIGQVAP
ncbi:MAG: hypothetical protein HKN94_12230 [Acidimicrobiales bacterium]|nr:hypothetical protein [Acidimicrobiales bacterium]